MLFLFNTTIIELTAPEIRLDRCWPGLGCGEPANLRARDAVDFVRAVLNDYRQAGETPDTGLTEDLAALLVAKTGANAALFVTSRDGMIEPRLTVLPEPLLQAMATRLASEGTDAEAELQSVWPTAA